MKEATILYVEDDETLGFVTRDNLEQKGYVVHHCNSGTSAEEAIRSFEFDLAILDVMLPGVDGFTLAEQIRKRNKEVPIIFLTAKILKEDRLHGFGLGGDDYVTKPFSIEELIFKIEVFLKRRNISSDAQPSIQRLGTFEFDFANLTLSHEDGESRTLTQREADLINFLLKHKNTVLRRSDILETIWGEDDYFLGRSLDVFISRLRKYLKKDPSLQIMNVHGVGFKLNCE
ncbi:MAG: response regulator transcription factor [Saprospiraceae bacterium]|nr:response regulator transcription factor [Saprospiraceae bacterium]